MNGVAVPAVPRGEVSRARTNVAVLRRLKEITCMAEVTDADRVLFRQWSGWGPMAAVLAKGAAEPWASIRGELAEVLDDEQWGAAVASTPTSFFTPSFLASSMWRALTGLGVTGGRILDPGCGHGLLMDAAPAGVTPTWTGIESDPVSARIATYLHPNATIHAKPFERVALVAGSMAAVIANVPFGDIDIYDPADDTLPRRIHNYFIARAGRAVVPGGIAVILTSRFTLDSQRGDRSRIATDLDLLGAVRLPSGTFRESGTEVVADLLILRRRLPGKRSTGPAWSRLDGTSAGFSINEYFVRHPEQVVGNLVRGSGRYGDDLTVEFDGPDLPAAVDAAVDRIVTRASIRAPRAAAADRGPRTEILQDAEGRKEGSFHVVNGTTYEVRHGRLAAVRDGAELRALIDLRDATMALIEAEVRNAPDGDMAVRRAGANRFYDAYVARWGAVNRCTIIEGAEDPETGVRVRTRRRPAMDGFRRDPDYVSVLSLEQYDDDTGEFCKAPILLHRVNRLGVEQTHADTPGDAIALSLDRFGRLDLDYITSLLGCDGVDATVTALGDLVYENPTSAQWETAADYLSGDVRAKHDAALAAASSSPERFSRNVTALAAVVPVPLEPSEIRVRLGAPWIPATDVEAFLAATIDGEADITVSHTPALALWKVEVPTWHRIRPAATAVWGTGRVDAYAIAEHCLNNASTVVYDTVSTPDRDRQVRNIGETMLALDKARALHERFGEWIWEDPERADRLADIYNRRFNSTVLRHYDGRHLTFPGLTDGVTPYASQRDIVYRIVSTPSALCGFAVGAGKTLGMAAAALTLRRLGLATKPMIAVPNHLLEQVARDIKRFFPASKVLMASSEDITAERRRLFAARCASGDWDAIVITHTAFTAIPMSAESQSDYIEEIVSKYELAMRERGGDIGPGALKRLAREVHNLRVRQLRLVEHATDTGLTFEQTGVDWVAVDEGHYMKNLGVPCRMEGFSITASKRAQDLAMKFAWLRKQSNGARWGALFTGTPVSNSMAELFVMQTYLQPDRLAALDLDCFDAWASAFVEFGQAVEVGVDSQPRVKNRPRRFVNVPDLRRIFAEVADIRTQHMLGLDRPSATYSTEVLPPSPELTGFIGWLADRAEAVRSGGALAGAPANDNMLLIGTHGRLAALDISLVELPKSVEVAAGNAGVESKAERVAANVLAIWRAGLPRPAWQPTESRARRAAPGQLTLLDALWDTEMSKPATGTDAPPGVVEGTGVGRHFQIVFGDLGTPKPDDPSIYGRIRSALIAGGMPAGLVRFAQDATTDSAKAALHAACRAGHVAVLLGSTSVLGTGVNIQRLVAAVHHIDAPWRPADVEQREGRALRPGNEHAVVRVIRYVTQGSFDAFVWSALERKARFIEQVLTGALADREIDDIGETVLSFSEVKALATGNPLLLEHAEVQAEVMRLRNLQIGHVRGQRRAEADAQLVRTQATRQRGLSALWMRYAESIAEHGLTFRRDHISGVLGAKAVNEHMGVCLQQIIGSRYEHTAVVGIWCGMNTYLRVRPTAKDTYVEIVLRDLGHDDCIVIPASAVWGRPDQRWRFHHALDASATEADRTRAGHQRTVDRLVAEAATADAIAASAFGGAAALQAARDRLAEIDRLLEAASAEADRRRRAQECGAADENEGDDVAKVA